MAETDEVTVTMALQDGYRFLVDFQQEGVPGLLLDEPEPLGEGRGPNAARVLAAAVGNCLSASALFCLRKARVDVRGMRTTAQASAACGPPRRPPRHADHRAGLHGANRAGAAAGGCDPGSDPP